MLPDERTTNKHELPLPIGADGLIVAPGRVVARPLVGFLRGQGLTVRIADDADGAVEEALLHPPDIVLIDDSTPPAGGVDLCRRLKDNVRTHFVPVIVCGSNDWGSFRTRALDVGADAVFVPSTDAEERRARLWALLRTRALYKRVDRRQRKQKNEIVERRHWLSHFLHDLTGQLAALAANVDFLSKFPPPAADERRRDFDESVSDARSVFEHLRATVRNVLDYDRFETAQLVPRRSRFLLTEAASEVAEELRRHAVVADKTLSLTHPPTERALTADRELLSVAMLNLGMAALKRIPPHGTLAIEISETDTGMRFRIVAPGPPLLINERIHAFEPYSRSAAGAATAGLGLALAQAVIGLHDGKIWAEQIEGGKGCAFVFELGWLPGALRTKRVLDDGQGGTPVGRQ